MKFFYYLLLLTVLIKKVWVVLSLENFEETELKYLAEKLNPTECLRLLENIYLMKPINDEEYAHSETRTPYEDGSLLRRQRETPFLSPENCRIKLEEWIHNLPGSSKWARAAVETALRTLGRPDLAQYLKRNRRLVQYFEDIEGNSRNSRNAAKSHKVSHPGIAKAIQVTPAGKKKQNPPKGAVARVYHTPASKALRGKSILEKKGEIQGANSAGSSQSIEDDDSRTRWTAFFILLGVIALTILATVFFALYKKNRGSFFHIGKKDCEDRYPLANRFNKKPLAPNIDIEQGSSTSCSPCGRKKRREFSTEETSHSPSSFFTKEKKILIRKPKKNKFVKEKLNKRGTRKCDKTCTGVIERGPASMLKIDKCTRTKKKKCCEKSQCTEPLKPRLDLKTFHDKIANILRKDDNSCKCCKCNAFAEVNDCICLNQTKKNMCTDEKCHKFKLKSIAELCLSSDELSPTKPAGDDLNRKKKKKRKKEKDNEKNTDMEKECCEKSCTENSARSKDKKELKIREKKMKKKKCNVEDDCKKKTCLFRKSPIEKTSHLDKNF